MGLKNVPEVAPLRHYPSRAELGVSSRAETHYPSRSDVYSVRSSESTEPKNEFDRMGVAEFGCCTLRSGPYMSVPVRIASRTSVECYSVS